MPPPEHAMPLPHAAAPGTALDVLQRTFGHPAFRGPQAGIVEHIAGGGDCLVRALELAADGAGKAPTIVSTLKRDLYADVLAAPRLGR